MSSACSTGEPVAPLLPPSPARQLLFDIAALLSPCSLPACLLPCLPGVRLTVFSNTDILTRSAQVGWGQLLRFLTDNMLLREVRRAALLCCRGGRSLVAAR